MVIHKVTAGSVDASGNGFLSAAQPGASSCLPPLCHYATQAWSYPVMLPLGFASSALDISLVPPFLFPLTKKHHSFPEDDSDPSPLPSHPGDGCGQPCVHHVGRSCTSSLGCEYEPNDTRTEEWWQWSPKKYPLFIPITHIPDLALNSWHFLTLFLGL